MADLDKTIKGLECCTTLKDCTDECPYYADQCFIHDLHTDALELLKEKQPVKPKQFEKKSKVTRDKYECGACGSSEVFKQWEYCPWCGVKLDW